MRNLGLALLAVLLTLASCTPTSEIRASASTELAIITITEDRRMAVLLLDALPASMERGSFEDDDLSLLVATLSDLAIVTGRMSMGQEDGRVMLDVLREGASSLRKTRLADTLASVSGAVDSLGELAGMQSAELFDLRDRVGTDQITEDWLQCYTEEIRRYLRRR
ncbi:MAG TPA: hypothetical protein PLK91_08035 [Sphaerochaeta sp.]|nr:hypothetical protein [Sphaerochaeta sp.]